MLHYLSLVSICLTVSSINAGWVLVFSDNFDRIDSIDRSKWAYDIGGDGWGNHEQQYYTRNRDNARCERFPNSNDGRLIIEARRERHGRNEFTSARLRTHQAWTYGRWQIRAKVPSGRGLWPAIWMLPQHHSYGDKKWPDNGEINIMEQVGFDPLKIHSSVHTKAHNHKDNSHPTNHVIVNDATTNFKIYTLDWEAHRLRMFVGDDSNPLRTEILFWNKQDDWTKWPFDKPFYLIINLAVGGGWGGQEGIDKDIFPAKFEIDWVKYYQWRN